MFDVGDSVFYPMHGVGIVERIEEKDMLGERAKYYILRFITSKLTAMVPGSLGRQRWPETRDRLFGVREDLEYLDAAAGVMKAKIGISARDNLAKSRAATYTTLPTL